MDSLAVSAIGLAAGGRQNVKLVASLYMAETQYKNVPTWKMGICQIPKSIMETDHGSGVSVFSPMTNLLVVPGTNVEIKTEMGHYYITAIFNTTSISVTKGDIVAILFTWS